MERMQRHGIQGIGKQREHRDVLEPFDEVNQRQHPKHGKPRDEDAPLQGFSKEHGGPHRQHDERSVVDQHRQAALPPVFGKHRFIEQPRSEDQQGHAESQRDQAGRHVGHGSKQRERVFVLNANALEHVAQHQQGEVDGAGGVNEPHGDDGEHQPNRMMAMTVVRGPQQHQQPDHQTELACDARVARIEHFGEECKPKPHGQHGLAPGTVAIECSHQPEQQRKQRVVPQHKHRSTGIGRRGDDHPSGERRKGGGVRPEPFVGSSE